MASFVDPTTTFAPLEVIERLLEIKAYYGYPTVLHITSSADLSLCLDSFGFDVYSLTSNADEAFDPALRTVHMVPTGSRSHDSATRH